MHKFVLKYNGRFSKVKQIAQFIARDIEKGMLQKDHRLPSINEFSEQYSVARDTIEKAYKELKEEGYIFSEPGRGYFVSGKSKKKIKVLLIFNKISSYKKIVYDGIIETLGEKAKVDLQIHHYNPRLLKEIIDSHVGHYNYYVIMPHFFADANKHEYLRIIKTIPPTELVILDRNLPELGGHTMAVFQDFREDIYEALTSATDVLNKYHRLVIIFPDYSNHPTEIIAGISQFCKEQNKDFSVCADSAEEKLVEGTVYILITESDLAEIIKKIRSSDLRLGKNIGVISFNETVLKELLEITVITTDFYGMGRRIAQLMLNKELLQVKNPFKMIRRLSL